MNAGDRFIPPLVLRHPLVQTVLCSSRLRTLGRNPMAECARETIIDAGNGVRLQGFWSRRPRGRSKALVILLHGWEGSADSAYILSTGRFLFDRGYDIFRLNYRDHGHTHHLNPGLFLGTLIDEVFSAVSRVAAQAGGCPVYLAGFSIGGNFAIRVARRAARTPIPQLKSVVSINPPLDPMKGTRRIDELRLIKRYFLKKWKRSLKIKQALFPDRYDFRAILKMDNCMQMTETMIRRHSDFQDAADYFSRYTLTRDYLDQIPLPLTVITAADDPVVPVEDFHTTKINKNVSMIIQPYGGHCGFITGPRLETWFQEWMQKEFSRITESDTSTPSPAV